MSGKNDTGSIMPDELICDSVLNDYYSAGIKAEVVLDTMMTPVIADLLKEQISFFGEPVYITKEFPLKTSAKDHRNRKADYVLMDNESIYLVELKTSMGSIDKEQLDSYGEKLGNYNYKGKKLLDEFTELLKSIYGITDEENCDLVSVTDRIVKSLTDNPGITTASIRIEGKLINVKFTVKTDVAKDDAKTVAGETLKLFSEKVKNFYDIQFMVKKEKEEGIKETVTLEDGTVTETTRYEFPIMGYSNKKNSGIWWSNN